jgi:hypothetical protein
MATTVDRIEERIELLSPEDARALFDEQARKTLGIAGDEFIRRWDAGEFDGIADDPDRPEIMRLAMMISFGR